MAFDKQKQLDLFDRYRLNPSTQLRNQIAIANQGLVKHIANRLVKQLDDVDFDDLFQVGFIGLIRSIERYDRCISPCFSSYAIPFIRGAILHYLRDKHSTTKVDRKTYNFISPSKKAIEKLTLKLGRHPTDLEIANDLEINLDRWLQIKQSFYESFALSLNMVVVVEGENPRELIDFVPDRSQFDRSELNEILTDLVDAIDRLDWKEKQIFEYVYLENITRKDVAKLISVSPMTVTRYLERAIQKLKKLMLQY